MPESYCARPVHEADADRQGEHDRSSRSAAAIDLVNTIGTGDLLDLMPGRA
jgi:hypothetical protein